ncbi:hypothetical protein GCM10011506_29780 [Marivirga lumbricoides]|uniref:Uncharacterized protein n=2 Tax=Marivirga lumbricoides TaxID=1046115 RepID=A0ABQ1MLB2_9BACT|nr:hypothetical protein GCM10011506_29780 [Marivirga lumbricoides]
MVFRVIILITIASCTTKEVTECEKINIEKAVLFFESGFDNDKIKVEYQEEIVFEKVISTDTSLDLAAEMEIEVKNNNYFMLYLNNKRVSNYCLGAFIEIDKINETIDYKSVTEPKKYQ